MDNNNGAEKLVTSILEEAGELAAAYEAQAAADIETIKADLGNDREKLREEFAARAQAEREDIIKRAETNAELDCRRELLERKHGVIDAAYLEAEKRLNALSGREREEVLARILKRECEGGETICPAPKDRELIKKLIPVCGAEGLTLGENAEGIDGGFTAVGANFVKDCSFKALMEDVKAETLTAAAAILFD